VVIAERPLSPPAKELLGASETELATTTPPESEGVRKERTMASFPRSFSLEEARKIGEAIGIDWSQSPFDAEQFRMGMDVELEHGRRNPTTDVTHDDPTVTGKIALAHLNEFPDYYTRLAKMEAEGEGRSG
jgi:hypothetical protein